jgi:ATP-dependent RNA helicase DeaD
MKVWLQRAIQTRGEMVTALVEEGFDPLEIAAAALKIARADEKQRPIAQVSEVQEVRSRRYEENNRRPSTHQREHIRRSAGRPGQSRISHEDGMVRLTISRGREHGVRPNDVVSTIAYHADIPGYTIGKIFIQDQVTLVDVPEQFLSQVLSKSRDYRINKQPINVELANKQH